MKKPDNITIRSLVLGALFSGAFALLTVILENRYSMLPTANQLPLFPFVLLAIFVLLLNPLLRLLRFLRPLSLPEMLIIFVMCMVSSGISTFGLTGQLIPIVGGLYNRHWNNDQTEWNRYVDPYLNDNFFIAEPGIQNAARAYADELNRLNDTRGRLATTPSAERAALEAAIDAQTAVVQERREALRQLENLAFAKVQVYRRGLPRDRRAFPGVLFTSDDDASSYFRRLGRLRQGRRAARLLQAAPTASDGAEKLKTAAELLAPSADAAAVEKQLAALAEIADSLAAEIRHIDQELIVLHQDKRAAPLAEIRRMEKDIEKMDHRRTRITKERTANAKQQERVRNEVEICGRVAAATAAMTALSSAWPELDDTARQDRVAALLASFPAFDASLTRYFVGDVPWSHWVRPLVHWGILIGLTYMILMCFNVLIFRQWAYHEKLIFPLAELPEIMTGVESGRTGADRIPALFKNGLFWVGFAIAGGVMGWNLLCHTGLIPGLKSLDLINSWTPFIKNSMFKGLLYGARSVVFFTMIGVAFLIPQKVSFSLWFFHVLYMVALLVLVGLGFGQNESSFPTEWWYTLNFRTATGAGAMLVFASLVLWKCRHMLLCALRPGKLENVTPDESRELRVSSALFLAGSAALVLALWGLMHINFFYAVFGYAIILVFTIGLIRAVAEGGIPGFQAHASPFHYIRNLFGFDKPFTAPHLVAPLMVFYSILFLDIKTFIAPAMANALKIRDDLRLSRMRYHLGIVIGIAVAVVVSLSVAIMLSYDIGADAMQGWFYTSFPKSTFARIGDMAKVPPMATAMGRGWLIAGAVIMSMLLYFRQSMFWLPHPIGLIMLINPLMRAYWFSLLLGWLAKALVTKYANKDTYTKVRGLFIGLILGEFFIIALAMVLSLIMQKNLGMSLNLM